MASSYSASRNIRSWLLLTTFTILVMIGVGGLTRLTESGLSIVEWKPVTGALPPLNHDQWEAEFDKYKQSPQFKTVNVDMQLEDFKTIYAWEYSHRLLGRLIGVIFAVPLMYFAFRRRIKGTLAKKLFVALCLGGLQGVVGWYMVKSGLVDMPRVSHYRLATHLGLAMFLMVFLYSSAQDIRFPLRKSALEAKSPLLPYTIAFLALVSLQIFYGALTAGLRAGHLYNTFPLMNGAIIPAGLDYMGGLRDLFDNPVTVQFIHRCLGWSVFFAALALAFVGTKTRGITARQRVSLQIIGGLAVLQFTLGVVTLLYMVPVALGSMHQIGASLLLLATVHAVHAFRESQVRLMAV
ncbi:MAG: COX15/CtaA family protein [Chitinophagaceae bacterium]|nr:COX15/CtaA family protein [Oligoflexus sp.]